MNNDPLPLRKNFPKNYEMPWMLGVAFVTLLLGLFLPVLTLKELVFFKSTFSIVSGIYGLFLEGHYLLGIIIFLFSIVFPIFKLTVLTIVWFSTISPKERELFLHWLGVLGKWSMLDVFVVAVTIVITKISKFAEAEPRVGLYLFAVSIIVAMITTERMMKLIKPNLSETKAP